MKKVLVLAAAIALFATPALADSVKNSKHNLSSTSGNTITSSNYDEICVFCHTPHGGSTTIKPLWNRSATPTLTAASLYNSVTLEAGVSTPTDVIGEVNNSDAPLCLSCHDGASLTDGLLNPLSVGQPAGLANISGTADLISDGSNLTNDHPIGMDYSSVTPATEFTAEAGTAPNLTVGTAALPLYGSTGVMWCSSCHDVHDPINTPFLNTSNTGSALCLTCHVK